MIRGKTCNLTRDSNRNDLINHRIHGFSFHDFEDNLRCSRGKFSLIDQQNLTFKHYVDAEMSLEVIGSKRLKDGVV